MSTLIAIGVGAAVTGCGGDDGIRARAALPDDRSFPLVGQDRPFLFEHRGASVVVRLTGPGSDIAGHPVKGRAVRVVCQGDGRRTSSRLTTWPDGDREIYLPLRVSSPHWPDACHLDAEGLGTVAAALILRRELDRTLARDDMRFRPPPGALGGAERGVEFVHRDGRLTVTLTSRVPDAITARTIGKMARVGCGPLGERVVSRLVRWGEDRRRSVALDIGRARVGRCLLETLDLMPLASARMRG